MSSQSKISLGKAWIVAVVGILAAYVLAMNNYKVAATMVLLMQDFGITEQGGGFLITATSLTGVIFAIPAGSMVIKFGVRRMGLVCVIVSLIGTIMGALCDNYILLIISRFIEGYGFGTIATITPTLISMWFPAEKRGLPSGLYSTWIGLGMTLILTTSNFFFSATDPNSWHGVWWYTVVLLVVILVLFILFAKPPESGSYLETNSGAPIKISDGLKSPIAWVLFVGILLISFASVILTSFASSYCTLVLGTDPSSANSITSVRGLAMVVSGVITGLALYKVTTVKGRMLFFAIAMAFNIVAYATMFLWQLSWAMPYMIISGLILGMPMAIVWSMVPEFAPSPEHTGTLTGIMAVGQTLGGTLGSAIGGSVIAAIGYGPFTPIAATIGVVCFLLVLALFFMMKKKFGPEKFASADPYGIKENAA